MQRNVIKKKNKMFLSKRPNPTKEKPGAEAILLNDPNTTTNL